MFEDFLNSKSIFDFEELLRPLLYDDSPDDFLLFQLLSHMNEKVYDSFPQDMLHQNKSYIIRSGSYAILSYVLSLFEVYGGKAQNIRDVFKNIIAHVEKELAPVSSSNISPTQVNALFDHTIKQYPNFQKAITNNYICVNLIDCENKHIGARYSPRTRLGAGVCADEIYVFAQSADDPSPFFTIAYEIGYLISTKLADHPGDLKPIAAKYMDKSGKFPCKEENEKELFAHLFAKCLLADSPFNIDPEATRINDKTINDYFTNLFNA